MNKKIAVIFNPAARGDKARLLAESLPAAASEAEFWPTEAPGEALELARGAVAQGYDVVVAAGGDGTVNEVVNGLALSPVTLGVLPMGTMNVFAYEIGLPADLDGCWDVIQNGRVTEVDLARANDHYFIQLAGVGLDAQAVEATDTTIRRTIGPLSYVLGAAQVIGQTPPKLEIDCGDGTTLAGSFALIGNGRHYGGPFNVFSQAHNGDGLLDLLVFHNQGYLDVIRYLQGLLSGKPEALADVDYLQVRAATISSDQDTPVEIDGEVTMRTPVRFEMAEKRLRVLVP